MDPDRYLGQLAADVALIRGIALSTRGRAVAVPTCPQWTVEDLVRHVAHAYLNVASRRLALPEDVPPQDLSEEDPVAALDRGHAELLARLKGRDPAESCGGRPDTVGFWIRRMTHETAMHRVDAEQAVGGRATPLPADLAVDGIDETLAVFVWQGPRHWPVDWSAHLVDWDGAWVRLSTVDPATAVDRAWRVTVDADGTQVGPAPAGSPDAEVSGAPDPMLRWLWNRGYAGEVSARGDGAVLDRLRGLLSAATRVG
jgi:uncharacterized protein (TIGR03083 family)